MTNDWIEYDRQRCEVKSFVMIVIYCTIITKDFTPHAVVVVVSYTHRGISNFETHYVFQGLDIQRPGIRDDSSNKHENIITLIYMKIKMNTYIQP